MNTLQTLLTAKVFVVMAVSLGVFREVTLGYRLTRGASADLQYLAVKHVIERLCEIGCAVVSITFDGAARNISMFKRFGGSVGADNLESGFPHPSDPAMQIYGMFDAPHTVKLLRNLLYEYKSVALPAAGVVGWEYIERHYSTQKTSKLSLSNKLARAHIDFRNQKMKVKLAVQVFSNSVASSLEYLRLNALSGFQDSAVTEVFIRMVDRLFDSLNSRSVAG